MFVWKGYADKDKEKNTELLWIPPCRSQLEKDLETIESAIRTLISGGAIKEYKIGNRNAKKYELAELLTLKSQYKVELVREKQAETMANGLGNPRATFVRFDGAY